MEKSKKYLSIRLTMANTCIDSELWSLRLLWLFCSLRVQWFLNFVRWAALVVCSLRFFLAVCFLLSLLIGGSLQELVYWAFNFVSLLVWVEIFYFDMIALESSWPHSASQQPIADFQVFHTWLLFPSFFFSFSSFLCFEEILFMSFVASFLIFGCTLLYF